MLVLAAVFTTTLYALGSVGWQPWSTRFDDGTIAWPWDATSYFGPKYEYAAARISQGELPLWNPYEFCGIPFLATLQPGVVYPLTRLVYAITKGATAYHVLLFVNVGLAAAFTLALMRALGCALWPSVLAAAWITQPLWLARAYGHPHFPAATALVPLLMLLLRAVVTRPSLRNAVTLGTVAALQAVSGYPPFILATSYLLLLGIPFWLAEARGWLRTMRLAGLARIAGALGIAAVTAGLLASIQLLPSAELLDISDREVSARAWQQLVDVLGEHSPEFLRKIGVPEQSPTAVAASLWNLYGPVLLALSVLAVALRLRSPTVGYALGAFVLSACLPLSLLEQLPLYELVRGGHEWTQIKPFTVYLLAGVGLDATLRRRPVSSWTAAAIAITAIAVSGAWNLRALERPEFAARPTLGLVETPKLPEAAQSVCDLAPGRFRLWWGEGQLRGRSMTTGLPSIGGYEQSLLPRRVAALNRALNLGNGFTSRWWAGIGNHPSLAARMGLQCVVSDGPGHNLLEAGFVRVPESRLPHVVYWNEAALPRARLIYAARWAASPEQALEWVLGETVDPRETVVLEQPPGEPVASCPESMRRRGRVIIRRYEPELVVLDVVAACEAYLLLADTHAPGWSARVDGSPASILTADYAFRALHIGPGSHHVVFRYRPRSVTAGATLSLLGIALVAGLLVLPVRWDPLRPPHCV